MRKVYIPTLPLPLVTKATSTLTSLGKEEVPWHWQKLALAKYQGRGIAKAVTGAGKTFFGRMVAEKVGGSILVASHRLVILDQWKLEMKGVKDVSFVTFPVASKEGYKAEVDLLIVDEAHRSVSPKFIDLYSNIDYKNILGLTATPNDLCIEKCGDLICEVGYDEANVAPFIVYFHGISLTRQENYVYRELSRKISSLIRAKEDGRRVVEDILRAAIMKRRGLVYEAEKRLPYSQSLIRSLLGEKKKVLAICQRIEQANELATILDSSGVQNVIYHSGHQGDLSAYQDGKVRVCISVGMLKEGFDDIDTDAIVIVSTPLSEQFQVQAIGRGVRYRPGKLTKVHIILANGTTDVRALDYRKNYDFELVGVDLPKEPDPLAESYYSGKKYGFSADGRLWEKHGYRRLYMEPHPVVDQLQEVKRGGGSFVVSEDGVYTKVGDKIVKVSDEVVEFEPKGAEDAIGADALFGKLTGGEDG